MTQIVVELAFASSVLIRPHARVSTNGEQLSLSVVQTEPRRVTHWASGILAWNACVMLRWQVDSERIGSIP